MMNADYEKMKQCIMEALSQKTGFDQDQSGCFSYEIYPDYRDEMDNDTAVKILASESSFVISNCFAAEIRIFII